MLRQFQVLVTSSQMGRLSYDLSTEKRCLVNWRSDQDKNSRGGRPSSLVRPGGKSKNAVLFTLQGTAGRRLSTAHFSIGWQSTVAVLQQFCTVPIAPIVKNPLQQFRFNPIVGSSIFSTKM